MMNDNVAPTDLKTVIADIAPLLEALSDRSAIMSRLLSACHEPIGNDDELQVRMALINELYSHAHEADDVAARFAEAIADRVYEYEAQTVLVPYASQAQALAFLMDDRGVRQKDLAAIATQSIISEILNNKRKMTVAHIKGFSAFFDVPVEFFMQGAV
ncbi:helix-turn-helix domain-containing protein [Pseudomonas sp. 3A(2025)]